MAKKVRISGVGDAPEGAATEPLAPEAGDGNAERPGGDATEHGRGAEEVGAPAAADDGGPSLEDLVPGLDEALGLTGDWGGSTGAEDPGSGDRARIAELEAEAVQLKDRLLRALADTENTRRRAERDRRDAEAYGGTRLARDLLAVYDNLERALAAADDAIRSEHAAFLEGVELTRRELENAFAKHKIQKIEPGPHEKFDPNRHQAVFEAPVPGVPNGTIIEVMAPGFTIAERLLRPAMVGVARGVPAAAPKAEETAAGTDGDAAGNGDTAKG